MPDLKGMEMAAKRCSRGRGWKWLLVCLLLAVIAGLGILLRGGWLDGPAETPAGPADTALLPSAGNPISLPRPASTSSPGYRIEPPDVLAITLVGESRTAPDSISVTGEYLVGPDGTINLRQYGTVHVANKTIADATAALKKQLAQYFDSPEVSLKVLACNSKVYYVITKGGGRGDQIVRIPITGKETVFDAMAIATGPSNLSKKEIWISRPSSTGSGPEQILPVDWDAITRGASTATNHQIMPGDRVFIGYRFGFWEQLRAAAASVLNAL